MRFADDILELYLRHFDDNEYDSLELFVHSILEQMDHNDLLDIIKRCNKEELNIILTNYLRDNIEGKLKNSTLDAFQQNNERLWKKVQ